LILLSGEGMDIDVLDNEAKKINDARMKRGEGMIDETTINTTSPISCASTSSLIDDVWPLVTAYLSPLEDYTALLSLLSTHRKAYRWICDSTIWRETIRRIEATPVWHGPSLTTPEPPPISLYTNIYARLSNLTVNTNLQACTHFLLRLVTAAPRQCDPLGSSQTRDTISCVLRIVRLALSGTQALYERHDQVCGFSSYTFKPLVFCGNMDWVSVSELYIYIDIDAGSDTTVEEKKKKGHYVSMMDSVMAPNFKSRVAFIDYHNKEVIEAWERDALIRNSFTVTPVTMEIMDEIETQRTHSLYALCINGYPLMHDEYKKFREKIYIYTGRPALFPLARWLNEHRVDLLIQLEQDVKRVTSQYSLSYVTGWTEENIPCIVERFIYKKREEVATIALPHKKPYYPLAF